MDLFTNRRRILSIWLPRLPTDRLTRKAGPKKNCAAPDKPLVVAIKTDNALRIYAADRKAARLGLKPGMPLADARAMIPALEVAEADLPADRALLENIAQWCDRFTPLVALDPPDGLLLDVTGVGHLFGGERGLCEIVHMKLAAQGFIVQCALAGTAAAARALSHYAPGTIAPPGKEDEAIAGLPVAALQLNDAIVHGLKRAGLKTIGQVASRTRPELAARFGKAMMAHLDHALGKSERPLSPLRPLPDFLAEHRFADPVTAQEAILACLEDLAAALGGILEKNGQGAREMTAVFFRADGAVRRLSVQTGAPTRDAKIIMRLFRERIDSLADPLDPGFGFDLIRLEAGCAERQGGEMPDFEADARAAREVAFLVDRLAARFGTQRVQRFVPQDTHIPEAACAAVPAQYATPPKTAWQIKRNVSEAPRRPLRLLARPEPIEDVMALAPDSPPRRFKWRHVQHRIAHADGPERIAMEWWRHQDRMPARDYFRVEDEEGRRFWLYREGIYAETREPKWYIHGVFA
ncbi:MAG TPA: DNA polymerase Y family protein [Rhizomicrobium sp.]|nr:DNA polymerase Y family protein [Rhizomicrobium sp.]